MIRALGQAMGFIRLVVTLGIGAVLFHFFWGGYSAILDTARENAPGGHGAVQANDWLRTGGEQLPLVFLLMAFFGFISLAVFQRRYA